MTHLPYIIASYAAFAVVAVVLAVGASLRLGRATRRLRAVDPRAEMRAEMRAEIRANQGAEQGLGGSGT
jgi:HAMP domain-containing protein